MSEHVVELAFEGPFEYDREAMLADFFEANGYTRCATETLEFERGERGAGWWNSAMCALYTRVSVQLDEQRLTLRYVIDIEGQRLNEEDRKFWTREAEHLCGYLRGGPLYDLRRAEELRAQREATKLRKLGLVISFVIFCIVTALSLIGIL